jgi:hypothetical protein
MNSGKKGIKSLLDEVNEKTFSGIHIIQDKFLEKIAPASIEPAGMTTQRTLKIC